MLFFYLNRFFCLFWEGFHGLARPAHCATANNNHLCNVLHVTEYFRLGYASDKMNLSVFCVPIVLCT